MPRTLSEDTSRNLGKFKSSSMRLITARSYNPVRLMEMMRFFHRLPSIQTVRVDGACIDECQKLATGESNVNKIIIEHSGIHTDGMRQIMRHPKALEVLRYGTGGRFWTSNMYHYNIFPKELGRSLQQHKSTLRVLDFDLDNEIGHDTTEVQNLHLHRGSPLYDSDLDSEDIMDHTCNTNLQDLTSPPQNFGSAIGSFHDFESLTHLSIGIILLTGPDIETRLFLKRECPQSPFRLIDSLPQASNSSVSVDTWRVWMNTTRAWYRSSWKRRQSASRVLRRYRALGIYSKC